jgi:hypothetical protein
MAASRRGSPAPAPALRRLPAGVAAGSALAAPPAGRRLPAGSGGRIAGATAGRPPALRPASRRSSAGAQTDGLVMVPAAGCPPARPLVVRRSPAGSPPAASRLSPALIEILARMVEAKLAAESHLAGGASLARADRAKVRSPRSPAGD